MSRKPRYVEPPREVVEEHSRVLLTLQKIAMGELTMPRENFRELIGGMLRYVEGGELHGQPIPQLSWLPVFVLHIDAALKAKNDPLVACLTLSMYLLHDADHRMPEFAELIRSQQLRGRTSAAKRKAEGANTRTLMEAWERENDRSLTPHSSHDIASCSATIGKSESTVRNELYARDRERRAAARS
jgi:hypothetical protein